MYQTLHSELSGSQSSPCMLAEKSRNGEMKVIFTFHPTVTAAVAVAQRLYDRASGNTDTRQPFLKATTV